jgi:DNA methylase
MKPYFADDTITLYAGDCLDVLPTLPDATVDAVVTDPPAGVSFMGRYWDHDRGGRDAWIRWLGDIMTEAFRVLKPGGHALVWALPRTSHWTGMALEDAGFDIRDCVLHLFGSGFPKSLDVGKAIDKAAGVEREVVGPKVYADGTAGHWTASSTYAQDGHTKSLSGTSKTLTAPATDDARRWQGWGTALKPGQEIWWLVRKPLASTVAANVLTHGTGALNIDGCRTPAGQDYRDKCASVVGLGSNRNGDAYGEWTGVREDSAHESGRWPTNVVFTHSAACNDGPCAPDCPVGELDQQSGTTGAHGTSRGPGAKTGYMDGWTGRSQASHGDSGGASRFFPTFRYEAKAPASERPRGEDGTAHVTVKPLALMRWLVRLVTPPGGTVLDPFLGSGTTAEACVIEGFRCIGIERDEAHLPLIKARLAKPIQPTLGFEDAS